MFFASALFLLYRNLAGTQSDLIVSRSSSTLSSYPLSRLSLCPSSSRPWPPIRPTRVRGAGRRSDGHLGKARGCRRLCRSRLGRRLLDQFGAGRLARGTGSARFGARSAPPRDCECDGRKRISDTHVEPTLSEVLEKKKRNARISDGCSDANERRPDTFRKWF